MSLAGLTSLASQGRVCARAGAVWARPAASAGTVAESVMSIVPRGLTSLALHERMYLQAQSEGKWEMYDMIDQPNPAPVPVVIRPKVQPYYSTLIDVWDTIDTDKYDAWGQPR